jgi:hypothetical protein
MLQTTSGLEQGSPLATGLLLTSLESAGVLEFVTTDNVDFPGVRVLASKPWRPGEVVLLSSPPEFHATAQIVQCRRLPNESYAIDIRLRSPAPGETHSLSHSLPLVD